MVSTNDSQAKQEMLNVSVDQVRLPVAKTQSNSQTTTNQQQPQNQQQGQQQQATNATAAQKPGTPDDPNLRLNASSASTPTNASATATPIPQLCDTSVSNLYCVYEVQPGDVLSTIAEKFGIKNGEVEAWQYLVNSNKPDIVTEDDVLQIGQKIRIPTNSGVLHTVLSTQTLGDIAEIYDVASKDITAVAINGIADGNTLRIGQEIIVPNPKQFSKPAPIPTPEPTTAPKSATAGSSGSGSSSSGSGPSAPAAGTTVRSGAASGAGLIWPTSGRISSYFGPSHPLGIDIDLFNNPNAPVGAAAAGTVTFAGGNACCSYGYYVVVSHSNGLSTLYAHFSKISVSAGEKVSQGELLGYGGRTGYATGNHLHFEVLSGGSPVNPLSYLP